MAFDIFSLIKQCFLYMHYCLYLDVISELLQARLIMVQYNMMQDTVQRWKFETDQNLNSKMHPKFSPNTVVFIAFHSYPEGDFIVLQSNLCVNMF